MLEIGSTIEATVEHLAPFGVFLCHGGDRILVPMDSISWKVGPEVLAQFRAGAPVRVLVERLNYEKNVYSGSIRRLDINGNPYRAISRLPFDTVFNGHVIRVYKSVVSIGVDGCVGELPLDDSTRHLKPGDVVPVRIAALEVEIGKLELRIVNGA